MNIAIYVLFNILFKLLRQFLITIIQRTGCLSGYETEDDEAEKVRVRAKDSFRQRCFWYVKYNQPQWLVALQVTHLAHSADRFVAKWPCCLEISDPRAWCTRKTGNTLAFVRSIDSRAGCLYSRILTKRTEIKMWLRCNVFMTQRVIVSLCFNMLPKDSKNHALTCLSISDQCFMYK